VGFSVSNTELSSSVASMLFRHSGSHISSLQVKITLSIWGSFLSQSGRGGGKEAEKKKGKKKN
jgi:hypothetical protein